MKLTALTISNHAMQAADALPDRLKLLAWGANPAHAGFEIRVGAYTQRMLTLNQDRLGLDRVAIDFEHNTVPGSDAYEKQHEPRSVAGYGVPELIPGEGLFLGSIIWTPHGEEFARDYCDLSPTVREHKQSGEVDFVHSVALTRAGAIKGLSFFSVELVTKTQGEDMDWKAFMAKLAGVDPEVSDEELMTAIEAKMAAPAQAGIEPLSVKISEIEGKLTVLSAGETGETGDLTALSQTMAAITDEVKDLEKAFGGMQRERIVEQAALEGKVIPLSAEQIAGTELGTLREMVGKLPVTVPVTARTPEHLQALNASSASAAVEKVARMCGQDPAHVAEVNKR